MRSAEAGLGETRTRRRSQETQSHRSSFRRTYPNRVFFLSESWRLPKIKKERKRFLRCSSSERNTFPTVTRLSSSSSSSFPSLWMETVRRRRRKISFGVERCLHSSSYRLRRVLCVIERERGLRLRWWMKFSHQNRRLKFLAFPTCGRGARESFTRGVEETKASEIWLRNGPVVDAVALKSFDKESDGFRG